MGNQLAPMTASPHPQTTLRAANNGDVDGWDSNGGVLPQDVLIEVLLCLPADLLRAPRAVCRSWRSLLSDDPLFAAARHPFCRFLAVSARAVFEEVADLELLDTSSGTGRVVRRVPQCVGPSYRCNPPLHAHGGLVLVVGDQNGERHLRVIDPFTGAVSVFPEEPGYRKASVTVLGRAVPMDGEKVGDYKVFSISVDYDRKQSCKVLTLGNDVGAWREAQKPPVIVRCDRPWVAAVASGTVYVLEFDGRDETKLIAVFDLEREQWRPGLLQGPPASGVVTVLTEMEGRLVAVSGSFTCWDLWLLTGCCSDSDNDGYHEAVWQEMCTVPMSGIRRSDYAYEKVEEPVWVLNNGMVVFVVWSPVPDHLDGSSVVGERGRQDWVLRVYDPTRDTFKDVARLSNPTEVAIGVCTRSQLLACYVDQQEGIEVGPKFLIK